MCSTCAALAPAAAACVLMLCATGCVERKLLVRSEPSGATVTINDVEVGRTPLEAGFTYFGQYDVKVEKEGYEPLREKRRAATPVWEYPPIDIVTMALPFTATRTAEWDFTLAPAFETTQTPEELRAGVVSRARALREQIK